MNKGTAKMTQIQIIELFQILFPVAIYFSGSAIARSGFITLNNERKLQIERRSSKADEMFDNVDRRL
jgi:hypothetical protein